MPTKEELMTQLREELRRTPDIKLITTDEYRTLKEIAAFKCPNNWNIQRGCEGYRCPVKNKGKNPFTDYYWECREARAAFRKLEAVTKGEIAVVSNGEGWTMPV